MGLAGQAKLAANVRDMLFAALRLRLAHAADVLVGAGGRGVGAHQRYAGAGGQADGRAVTQTHKETWPEHRHGEGLANPPGNTSPTRSKNLTNMDHTPHQHGPHTSMEHLMASVYLGSFFALCCLVALTGARAPGLRLVGEAELAAKLRGKLLAALRLRLARAADVPVGAGGKGVGAHQGYAGAGGQADGRVTQTHEQTRRDDAQT